MQYGEDEEPKEVGALLSILHLGLDCGCIITDLHARSRTTWTRVTFKIWSEGDGM
jgi:hypothetical protein